MLIDISDMKWPCDIGEALPPSLGKLVGAKILLIVAYYTVSVVKDKREFGVHNHYR